MLSGVPKLPLKPPIKPQLARSAKALPEGEEWRYEPKWDGFRTIAFKNGDDVYLQSRGGKPMNRYFPDVVKLVEAMPADQVVLDGEMVIDVDGVQEFDLLSQRIHPAESRVTMLAEKYPAAYIAFDLLATGGKSLMDLGYEERRERLAELDLKPVQLSPVAKTSKDAQKWLTGHSEGVVAKQAEAKYLPGERKGMVKIKRMRTADAVVAAFRYGKEEGTLGSLILGMYGDEGELHVVGHTSGFKAKEKRELLAKLEPYMTGESGPGEPSRWKSDEELVWQGLKPELVVEVTYDHVTGNRIRHGTRLLRWREDKEPRECTLDQLRT
jgi:ATP-dependent DNA ligase